MSTLEKPNDVISSIVAILDVLLDKIGLPTDVFERTQLEQNRPKPMVGSGKKIPFSYWFARSADLSNSFTMRSNMA